MISFNKTLTLQPLITTSSFRIARSEDIPTDKIVRALVVLHEAPLIHEWITVWEGNAYDAAGQWTDASLNAAVKAILESR